MALSGPRDWNNIPAAKTRSSGVWDNSRDSEELSDIMERTERRRPWLELEALVESGDASQLDAYLHQLAPGEPARALSRLDEESQAQVMGLLPEEDAAALLTEIPEVQAVEILEHLAPDQAAAIVSEVPSNQQVDLLSALEPDLSEAILDVMPAADAADVRRLAEYPADSAAGLMVKEYLAFNEDQRLDDVLADLRENAERYSGYDVQYAYVVSSAGQLVGVLRLRDLLFSPRQRLVSAIMTEGPVSVGHDVRLDELQLTFDRYPLFGLPVTNETGELLGVVRRVDVEAAVQQQANQTLLKFAGIVGGEEFRSMSLASRSTRRLSWLSINIFLNLLAASVIAYHQDTLAAVITLAVFLPIISDMSGCSGNQAVAVSMRELVLGLIKPYELLRVLGKEAAVGTINGVVLGAILGGIAFLWKGNPILGLVVGVALALNTLIAVCLGGAIPLLLKKFRQDPALASGPILTTLTDMCGFFLVLSLARAVLPWLIDS
jgi:magnesium transporter